MKKRCLQTLIFIVVVSLLCGSSFAKDRTNEKAGLSAVVQAIVNALFPSASIEKVETEEESIKVIEVDLKQGGKECSVNVTEDGTVLSLESEVSAKSLPPAVAKSIKKVAGKAKIRKIEKEEIRAVVKIVKLPKPVTVYEAKLIKDGKECEIKVASCGKVLAVKAVAKDGDDEDKDGNDEDADDEDGGKGKVSIKKVPKAVRATILKEVKGGKIEDIERMNKDGKVIFEADVFIGSKSIELRIAGNGKLLSKKVEDDGDDDKGKSKKCDKDDKGKGKKCGKDDDDDK